MALADYKVERREHTVGGAVFSVQGLNLKSLTQLIQKHLEDMEAVWKLGSEVMSGNVDLTADDLALLANALATEAPALISNMIAVACGEGDNPAAIEAAHNLPFGTQVAATFDILELSFTE